MKQFSQNLEDIRIYEDKTNNLHSALRIKTRQLENQMENIKRLGEDSARIGKNLSMLQKEKNDFVRDMNNFGTSHLNVQKTLEEGKLMLKEMDAKAKSMPTVEDNDMIFSYCNEIRNLLKSIYKMESFNINKITDNIEDLKMRFEDLNNLSEFVKKQTNQIKLKNKDNNIKYHDINKTISVLKNRHKKTMDDIAFSRKQLKEADQTINKIKKLANDVIAVDLDSYFETLENRDQNYEENAPEIVKKMKDIEEHVKHLHEVLIDLKRSVQVCI